MTKDIEKVWQSLVIRAVEFLILKFKIKHSWIAYLIQQGRTRHESITKKLNGLKRGEVGQSLTMGIGISVGFFPPFFLVSSQHLTPEAQKSFCWSLYADHDWLLHV